MRATSPYPAQMWTPIHHSGVTNPVTTPTTTKAHQEPMEQPRWQVPDLDPTAGCRCGRPLFLRHLHHRVAFRS